MILNMNIDFKIDKNTFNKRLISNSQRMEIGNLNMKEKYCVIFCKNGKSTDTLMYEKYLETT